MASTKLNYRMSGISELGLSCIRVALLALALLQGLLLSGCSSLTSLYFHPQTVWIQTPEALGLDYQDVWLTAVDGTQLHAWWIPPQPEEGFEESDSVVLYLHGNAENISSHIRSVDWLPKQGVGLLALDYRGFGASQGQAIMPEVLQDIEAAAIWLRQSQADKQLVVLGQSIGAALAVNFVAAAQQHYQIQALVLDAPFSGFPQIARAAFTRTWLGWLFVPATWLIPSDWNPQDKAAAINIPTLVMHSPEDSVIPYEQGQSVYAQLAGEHCWLESQGPHIGSFFYEEIRLSSQLFIENLSCSALDKR